tara:strand:- start:55 stop:816 length:762 start_codon:yes stop_codon:yes gene_type:complete
MFQLGTHKLGVDNEHLTIKLLNRLEIYPDVVIHLGGTQNKADAIAGDKKISIKHKKSLASGSFDWFNTSKHNAILGDTFDNFIANTKELRTMPKSITTESQFVLKIRDNFNELCEQSLDSLTSTQINEILECGLKQGNDGYDIIINDTESCNLYKFEIEQHPAVKYIKLGYTPLLVGSGKSSRKIVFKDDNGNIHDNTGLRLRVTNNNGINAFLGNSKANKNSQVVMKLQQDGIKNLVDTTKAQKIGYEVDSL